MCTDCYDARIHKAFALFIGGVALAVLLTLGTGRMSVDEQRLTGQSAGTGVTSCAGQAEGTPCYSKDSCYNGVCKRLPVAGTMHCELSLGSYCADPDRCDSSTGTCNVCRDTYLEQEASICSTPGMSGCETDAISGKCCCAAAFGVRAWCCHLAAGCFSALYSHTLYPSLPLNQVCDEWGSGAPGTVKTMEYGTESSCLANCPVCGDGKIDPMGSDGISGTSDDEQCDDGRHCANSGASCNTNADCSGGAWCVPKGGDGCSATCKTEAGSSSSSSGGGGGTCGDGVPDFSKGEQCDDGNTNNDNDGCTNNCTIHTCGDGIVAGPATPRPDQCDDGNTVNTDSCTNACKRPACGDGIINTPWGTFGLPVDQCDDGNTSSGDGCSSTCTNETSSPVCGNRIREGAEQCDDGNTITGDGCSIDCKEERPAACGDGIGQAGEECDDGNTIDTDNCTGLCKEPRCGDGFVRLIAPVPSAVEECDDGNTVDSDACSNSCKNAICGDGVKNGTEECDDGKHCSSNGIACLDHVECPGFYGFCGTRNQDGCSTACKTEVCGDGIKQEPREQCDDGNTVDTDACTNACTFANCGDGFKEESEECDDGNAEDDDACTRMCKFPVCGDERVQVSRGEFCDRGTANSDAQEAPSGCRTDCKPLRCGDGILDPSNGESCDDGNTVNTDGCTNTCGFGTTYSSSSRSSSSNSSSRSSSSSASSAFNYCAGGNMCMGNQACQACGGTCAGTCTGPFQSPSAFACNCTLPPGGVCCGNSSSSNFSSSSAHSSSSSQSSSSSNSNSSPSSSSASSNSNSSSSSNSNSSSGGGSSSLQRHTACEGSACVILSGPGSDQCQTSDDCDGISVSSSSVSAGESSSTGNPNTHTVCQGEACIVVSGPGGNECNLALGCGIDNHRACSDGTCILVAGGGGHQCTQLNAQCNAFGSSASSDGDNPSTEHTECQNDACVVVSGPGIPACHLALGCGTQRHLICRNLQCEIVSGAGANQCATAEDCLDRFNTSSFAFSPPVALCGNSRIDPGEQCDDGIRNSDTTADACRTTCRAARCGDYIVDRSHGEMCDQGSGNSGTIPDRCRQTCQLPRCGDGVQDSGEQCDDGNSTSGDGCSNTCTNETVLIAGGVCGDGRLDLDETCDDGNRASGDGCSAACSPELQGCVSDAQCSIGSCINGSCIPCGSTLECAAGNRCVQGSCIPTTGTALLASALTCGDGLQAGFEECDDGNLRDSDGCSSDCFMEQGFCGDNVVQRALGETCEPVLHVGEQGYACNLATCRFLSVLCGDGKVDRGEECDDGTANGMGQTATCRSDCSFARCGDRILGPQESCDDGNRLSGDGCDALCQREQGAAPTAGTQIAGERQTPWAPAAPQQQNVFAIAPTTGWTPWGLTTAQLQPIVQGKPPAGDTGPAAVIVITSGAAAGYAWMRRKRRSE